MSEYTNAMRVGWEKVEHRQAFGVYFRDRWSHPLNSFWNTARAYRACADGCAMLGGVARRVGDELRTTGVWRCPAPHCHHLLGPGGSLGSMAIHLNDDHRWKVDRIADYLDTLEPES